LGCILLGMLCWRFKTMMVTSGANLQAFAAVLLVLL
jgi:hypothetical protein